MPLTGELILILYLTGLKVYYHEEKTLPEGVPRPGNEGYVTDGSKREEAGQGQRFSPDHTTGVAGSEGEVDPGNGTNSGRVR